jgi:hypothetical protein
MEVAVWGVFETAFESETTYENPFWDVDVRVRFTGPEGQVKEVDAFWDGFTGEGIGSGVSRWGARFSPDAVGPWQWETSCSDSLNTGLHGQRGNFTCVPYVGQNPLYRYGPVRLSGDRRFFTWANGSPFFWLADTAWNGVLRSNEADWERYLTARQNQGFSVVQFVSTQWRGAMEVLGDERAFAGTEHITIFPDFFRSREPRITAINEAGLVAAPVILWAVWDSDPGWALAEADAIRLARYIVARWGAYQVIWFLGGDGNYLGERAERWRTIGRALGLGPRATLFGEPVEERDRLVTMHPGGQTWVGDLFRQEPWYDFIGYQSGHGSSDEHLRWLVEGPPATKWDGDPVLPVVNLEPNYEGHPSYHTDRGFTDYEVRRAAYWSLLLSPPVGISYGTNPIWMWADAPEVPDGHPSIGLVEPWDKGLLLPGIHSMTILRAFFEVMPWWSLRPAPEMLAEQPGTHDPTSFIAAAKTEDGEQAVLYLPKGGTVHLNPELLPPAPVIRWFDPRLGRWTDTRALFEGDNGSGTVQVTVHQNESAQSDERPHSEGQDWLLVITAGESV